MWRAITWLVGLRITNFHVVLDWLCRVGVGEHKVLGGSEV